MCKYVYTMLQKTIYLPVYIYTVYIDRYVDFFKLIMAVTPSHMKISVLTLGISTFLMVTNYWTLANRSMYMYYYDHQRAVGILLPSAFCCLVISFLTIFCASIRSEKTPSKSLKKLTISGCFLGGK